MTGAAGYPVALARRRPKRRSLPCPTVGPMEPVLEYDPAINGATLTAAPGGNWNLWMVRPDHTPGMPHIFTRTEVGRAIGEDRLSDDSAVLNYFEGYLTSLQYSTHREAPIGHDFLAAWALAPGRN